MTQKQIIQGWGRNLSAEVNILEPNNESLLKEIILKSEKESLIVRGLGRSYGDSAQLDKKNVVSLKKFNSFNLDSKNNLITAQAGVTFDELLKYIVPRGFFLPVSPGTRFVTVGGAIASDVHGKNHHIDGSFGKNIKSIVLLDGKGKQHILKPYNSKNHNDDEKFWSTVGGMGLTGVIVEATFKLIPISSSLIVVDTKRFNDLDQLMSEMIESDKKYRYSVAWVDSLHENFRGVLTCGDHLNSQKLKKDFRNNPLDYDIKPLAEAPNLFPFGLLNRFSVRAFNEAWFRKSPKLREGELQNIGEFFYPLDGIQNWNRIYGPKGFIQYQFVVPENASHLIKQTLETLRRFSVPSFLTVLKRFGSANPSYLSFPIPGWTLAIDMPANINYLNQELNKLDEIIVNAGGRIYLAKDSRQSSQIFKKSYPRIKDWLKIKEELDPNNIFMSDSFKRLL